MCASLFKIILINSQYLHRSFTVSNRLEFIQYFLTIQEMHRNQFEEQFQDSEANFSEAAQERADERSDGKPIQLLKIQRNGQVELNQEALNIIASCGTEVGFVSVVGKMRTGKSCLLNRMLGLAGKGFRVDSAVSSCTKGIWMWSEPVFNPNLNCFVFFLDTEGSDSLQKDAETDAKIFTLSLLISTYFVYNSVGCIDERSISDLEMITALSQHVRADQKLSERQNQQQLYRYMPKFVWVLRDVTLKIEDQYGRKISPSQYLQNCLTQQQPGAVNQSSRKIKKSLLNYFKDRECVTMVRPVGDQNQLQRLNSIPDHALRREFIEAVSNLRDKLIKGCGPKQFGGEPVIGPIMAQLIESFVETFNNNKVPSIKSAWQQVAQDEGGAAFNAAVVKYQQIFRYQFPDDNPKSEEQLRRVLIRLREQSTKQFEANCYGQKHDDYKNKLKTLIEEKQANIVEINKNVSQSKNNQILKGLFQKMKSKFQSNAYVGKKQEIQADLDQIIAKYNRDATGPKKAQILAEFIRNINPLMFAVEEDKAKQDQQLKKAKRKQEELEKTNKLKEQEIQSLRQQLLAKQNRPVAQVGSKPGKAGDKPGKQQRQTQGCCSGDKCEIM